MFDAEQTGARAAYVALLIYCAMHTRNVEMKGMVPRLFTKLHICSEKHGLGTAVSSRPHRNQPDERQSQETRERLPKQERVAVVERDPLAREGRVRMTQVLEEL